MGFGQGFSEKTMKNIIFHDFLPVWGLALGSYPNHVKITSTSFENHAKIMLNASLKHKVGAPSFLSSGEMFGHLALFSPKTVHCHVEVTEVCGSKPWLN